MDNSNNSTVIEEDTCPSSGGLQSVYGFTPGFNFSDLIAHPSQNWHLWGWLVCLLLLLITWIVALVTIIRHIRNYYYPSIQRHKLRVLLYPPIYATLAWFSYLRYDYSTTIMFFATLFEALAIYNLFTCLEAYLQPFRDEAEGSKEPIKTKVFGLVTVSLKSKFGFHFRTIITILVVQYPVWAIVEALISIISSVKGYYCGESYSFRGAYVYLTIINFTLLSLILSALFTYLAIFHNEWKRGQISAHGMFWCVKGPVMAIFYFGDILLSILKTCNVIKGTDGTQSSDGLAWPASAVKNGLDVIIICVTMMIASCLMYKYFGPQDQIRKKGDTPRITGWKAFVDAYVTYIPEFFRNILCCGLDSYRLARKRAELRQRKKDGLYTADDSSDNALSSDADQYRTSQRPYDSSYQMGEVQQPSRLNTTFNGGYTPVSVPP